MRAYRLPAVVDLDNLMSILAEGETCIDEQHEPVFDLADLKSASFAVLAVLVGWFRYAHGRGKVVRFIHVSPRLMNIVDVAELRDLLPIEARDIPG